MTVIVVEDGTVVAGANSYVSESFLTTYATARGITLATATDVLLIKAMEYIESLYFIGQRWTFSQTLQWPRAYVKIDGWYNDANTIPFQLKNGLCAVAVAIDAGNGPLEDLAPQVKSEKVGDIAVEYMQGTNSRTIARTINANLSKLLASGGSGDFIVRKA